MIAAWSDGAAVELRLASMAAGAAERILVVAPRHQLLPGLRQVRLSVPARRQYGREAHRPRQALKQPTRNVPFNWYNACPKMMPARSHRK
jgi:hypothetical protein